MDQNQINHKPAASPVSAQIQHVRRSSVLNDTNGLNDAIEESETQLTAHSDTSQSHLVPSMEYDSRSPSPLPVGHPASSSFHPVFPQGSMLEFMRDTMPNGDKSVSCFEDAIEQPPITKDSLEELDMPRIINNPKLRHDVNFDRDLHFRPNLDGTKGQQKIKHAEEYYKALVIEITTFYAAQLQKAQTGNCEHWDDVAEKALKRLPKLFPALREILVTLVPDYDKEIVKERLDVDHIMQQIKKGVCDLNDLGKWLAKMLKSHCAPMRDSLVDTMRDEIGIGARENKPDKLVEGLRHLFQILEAMKLDVANHQIRHMRPLLVEDTVNFQRRYNEHRISMGKINPAESRKWLQDASERLQHQGLPSSPVDVLISALVHDILFNDADSLGPSAFYLDADRLRTLRSELHSMVYHNICGEILKQIGQPWVSEAELQLAQNMLFLSLCAIVGSHGKWFERLENVAVEIVRVSLTRAGQTPPLDANLVEHAEVRLGQTLASGTPLFLDFARKLHASLVPGIQARTKACMSMSAMALQEMLVPTTVVPTRLVTGFGAVTDSSPRVPAWPTSPIEDVTRRLTHIAVLHWQVWAELVYLADPDDDAASSSSSDSDSEGTTIVQSGSNSPTTIPVAVAVYPEGKHWLPSGLTVEDVPTDALNEQHESESTTTSSGNEPGEESSSSPCDHPPRQSAI